MSVNRYFWPISLIDIFEMLVLALSSEKEEADSSSFAIICLSIVHTTNSC